MVKLKSSLLESLLKQASFEMNASNVYLHFSLWSKVNNYPGTAAFFEKESNTERTHALKILDFLTKRNELVNLPPNEEFQLKFEKPGELFNQYNTLETQNLQKLNDLAVQAQADGDSITVAFLNPMILEQLESQNEAELIANKAKYYSALPGLFYHLDHELGKAAK